MKEVVNINIGGLVFSIEEPAYKKLKRYLNEIEQHFKSTEAGNEITQDIESSIAEKFAAKKRSLSKAVTAKDVEEVIAQLGEVQDFDDDSEPQNTTRETSVRRLYRDTDNAIVGGVASGIANYFGVDPVIPRIVFILLIFWGGFGILAYLVLWLIVPAAKTAAQKLESKGEPTSLENVKIYMEEKLKAVPTKSLMQKAIAFPLMLLTLLLKFVHKILPMARIILGALLITISSLCIFAFSTLLMAIVLGHFEFTMDEKTAEIIQSLNLNRTELVPIALALYTCFILPTLLLFLGGIGLMFKKKTVNSWVFGVITFCWLLSLSFTVLKVIEHAPRINQVVNKVDEAMITNPNHDFYLRLNDQNLWEEEYYHESDFTVQELQNIDSNRTLDKEALSPSKIVDQMVQ